MVMLLSYAQRQLYLYLPRALYVWSFDVPSYSVIVVVCTCEIVRHDKFVVMPEILS